VSGVGEKKLEQYGDLMLETIREYCRVHSLQTNIPASAVE
jgi:hypothetical protein